MSDTGLDLVKRIARLVRQNQELVRENEDLKNFISRLKEENLQMKNSLPGAPDPKKTDKQATRHSSLKFDMATVMFANIFGFAKIGKEYDSVKLMDELDSIIYHFDRILKANQIHRIKSIGDTIMASGGIPEKNITNPVQVVKAALEMQDYLHNHRLKTHRKQKIWGLRIGIHTGPVSALVSGRKKLTYELKGDTVNMVTRMQNFVNDGEIMLSVNSYEWVKEFFNCEYYGKMPVKYQGDLELFTLKSYRSEFLEGKDPVKTNAYFDTKFKLIQFTDIQEYMLDRLEKELPSNLYYHNVKHTVDVVTEVELIGWAEGVSDEEVLLLKTAALFHDAGHIISYKDHEYHGTQLARDILPGYGYDVEQIEEICNIIMATKMPPNPGSLLEKIICDADLDYLGRSDMIPVSNTLYRELKEREMVENLKEWNELQLKFISGHQYFTRTAQNLREVNKQKQIQRIKQLIREVSVQESEGRY